MPPAPAVQGEADPAAQVDHSAPNFQLSSDLFGDELDSNFMEQMLSAVTQSPKCAGSSTSPESPPRKQQKVQDTEGNDSDNDDSVVFVSETRGRPPCSLCNKTSAPPALLRPDFLMCMTCYQNGINSSSKFWGHFFKLENGLIVEVLSLCRANKDSYCRVLKTFPIGNEHPIKLNGTAELKSSGFVAVLPRIDCKTYIFGPPERLFTHMTQARDTPQFVSTICPDVNLLLEYFMTDGV